MTVCTIVPTPTALEVKSPYNKEFAYFARLSGGSWDRDAKIWRFSGMRDAAVMQSACQRFYSEVVVADSFPVPVAVEDNGHVGKVGEEILVSVEVTRAIDLNGQYGACRLHVMKDGDGHVFTWFASKLRLEVGASVTLVGKVKRHDVREGVSQTVLTRCKKLG